MTDFVLDASVTMVWGFEDEGHSLADHALGQLDRTEAYVPTVWPLEVANVLLVAVRQERLTDRKVDRFVTFLSTLPIHIDPETPHRALTEIRGIARREALSAYDAAYLDVAIRHRLPLCTLDDRLRKAAGRVGVELFSESRR